MEVEFYRTGAGKEVIEEFLNSLPPKSLAKVLRDIELLAAYAPDLHEPYTKHIDGPFGSFDQNFPAMSIVSSISFGEVISWYCCMALLRRLRRHLLLKLKSRKNDL